MDELSDEEPEYLPNQRPALPGPILAAGMLWVVMGAFFALGSCCVAVVEIRVEAARPGPMRPNPVAVCAMWLGILIGLGFFIAGVRTISGRAADTLVTSVVSIFVGLFYIGFGVLALWITADPRRPAGPAAMRESGALGVVIGGGLLLPAGLALAARSQYLAWRATTRLPRRGRIRPHRSELDEDRPWERSRNPRQPWKRGSRDDDDL